MGNIKIAVVGATGVVGRVLLNILQERKLTNYEYSFFASTKSENKKIVFDNKKYHLKVLEKIDFSESKFDFAIFCTKEIVSKTYIFKFAKAGCRVIDFSSFYRKRFPLVVPEINGNLIQNNNLICNPNCSTIGATVALNSIHNKYGLKRIVFSTYQAVSGAGKEALDDLNKNKNAKLKKLDYEIVNNIIPYIGKIDNKGYSTEENKMVYECKKILNDKSIQISATCIRIPVDVCHTETINFTTRKKVKLNEIIKTFENSIGVIVLNGFNKYPMPILVKGKDEVYVGRIRKDYSQANTFNVVIVSDNLRRGSALNGVLILEKMLEGKWKKFLRVFVRHW